MEFEVKRFYLPEQLVEPCPNCKLIVEFDDYLSYPSTGPNEVPFYCLECHEEWVSMYDIQLIVTKIEEKK